MTSVRVLALAAGAVGLAVAGAAGLLPAGRSAVTAPRGVRAAPAAAFTSPATTTTTSTSTSTAPATSAATAGPAKPAPDLRDVPASILSRAADARALDRKVDAACRSVARSGTACAPQRDTVEIHWDVGKDP